MNQNPFLRPDAAGYPAIFADGIVHLLARRGLDRWSVGEIARWMKVTPAAVLQSFSRSRVVHLAVLEIGKRWVKWAASPPYAKGIPASLPESDEERHGVRVWALLGELARSERMAGRAEPEEAYVAAQREEVAFLHSRLEGLLERTATEQEVLETAALVTGLRALLVEPEPGLAVADAEGVLREHVERLRQAQIPSDASRSRATDAGGPSNSRP